MSGSIYTGSSIIPEARDVDFDNSINGFTAEETQSAIEEAKNTLNYEIVTGTSTLTRTASTFAVVNGMTITPGAGTYLAIWSCQINASNTSGQGEVAIFLNGTQQTQFTHQFELNVTVLLGTLGVAQITEGASNIMGIVTVDDNQAIDIRYRSVDGQTITITNRSFILIKVAL